MTKKEILYRAKSKAKGEWLYGHVFEEFFYRFKEGWVKEWVLQPIREKVTDADCRQIVDANTICDYTGLTDKNGTKIFEGDVINVYVSNWWCGHKDRRMWKENALIVYKDYAWAIRCGKFTTPLYDYINPYNSEEQYYFEVIGNKFDNPELLEGEL